MREKVEEYEENKVEVRKEDKTIRPLPSPQPELVGEIIKITSFSVIRNHKATPAKSEYLAQKEKPICFFPGRTASASQRLEAIASGVSKFAQIAPGARVYYYKQDFSTLDFEDTTRDSLCSGRR